jgi:hypothetical protein
MREGNTVNTIDARKALIGRVASSRYVNRSARLRDLLFYLSTRVLEEEDAEIHEQEVGHQVFGRPADYDTAADNIVRVHASMLRKRLDQYFTSEGAHEAIVLEIPKGNYAPVFRERPEPDAPAPVPPLEVKPASPDWRIWFLAVTACSPVPRPTCYCTVRVRHRRPCRRRFNCSGPRSFNRAVRPTSFWTTPG